MIATLIIAFREFLEAFLIVGVFLGVSRKLKLNKELEITAAAAIGIAISLVLAVGTYAFGDIARKILTEQRAELLSNYLLIFSGFFIVYVIFSLHQQMSKDKKHFINQKAIQLQDKRIFDISLFLTIIFMVAREGFEIALFTASTALFSAFIQNVIGLLIGLGLGSILGLMTFFAYTKFPIQKVFKWTEYMIILLGAAMVQVGLTELVEKQGIYLGKIISFNFHFLPGEDTVVGHIIRTFTGIDNEFSLARFAIMFIYILGVFVFIRQRKIKTV